MQQYNPYNPYYYNPNLNYLAPQMNRLNQMEQQYPQYANNIGNMQMMNTSGMNAGNMILQGKAVDSIDVVKAMDVPLDGSITYFPKADGTAIYTKQLQKDGTSKINIYEIKSENSDVAVNAVASESVSKEDIEKIYADISEVKKSLEENMGSIIKRFDDLKDDFTRDSYKSKLNSKGGK